MKTRAIELIVLYLIVIFFLSSCIQERVLSHDGMTFSVSKISDPATVETKTGYSPDSVILSQEDNLTITVANDPLAPVFQTKGQVYSQADGIGDESLGIVAVHYDRTGASVGNWKVYSPGFVRADAFSSGSSKAWLPSPSMSWHSRQPNQSVPHVIR